MQIGGLAAAGWALWGEHRQPAPDDTLPAPADTANPWDAPIKVARDSVSSSQRGQWQWDNSEQKARNMGSFGFGGAHNPSPDQVAFEKVMRITEEVRRAKLAKDWEAQSRALRALFAANREVLRTLVATHQRTRDRIGMEMVGLAFALVGTVISSLAT